MVRIVSFNDSWDWEDARRTCLQVARRYARTPSEAEDVAQEALVRAWRNRLKLRDTERRVEWIARIARNEAIRARDRRIPDPVEFPDLGGTEDENLVAVVEGSIIRDALNALSDDERELLRLRYEVDMTQSAIAEHLEMPEGTVKVKLYRIREKLRKGRASHEQDQNQTAQVG